MRPAAPWYDPWMKAHQYIATGFLMVLCASAGRAVAQDTAPLETLGGVVIGAAAPAPGGDWVVDGTQLWKVGSVGGQAKALIVVETCGSGRVSTIGVQWLFSNEVQPDARLKGVQQPNDPNSAAAVAQAISNQMTRNGWSASQIDAPGVETATFTKGSRKRELALQLGFASSVVQLSEGSGRCP
jgi:hypothetical protein